MALVEQQMTEVSITWSTRREGNLGYVLEQYSDGTQREFGPMAAHIVPGFVTARRRLMALRMERRGHLFVKYTDHDDNGTRQ
jgi:hypothetical protein